MANDPKCYVIILLDSCFPVNVEAHQRQMDALYLILDNFKSAACLFQVVYVGSEPPHHSYFTRIGQHTTDFETFKNEISLCKFYGGGFGSVLWDGVAVCCSLFQQQTALNKYLCVVPSAFPQSSRVKSNSIFSDFSPASLAAAVSRTGVKVSALLSFVFPDLEDFFTKCGGVLAEQSQPGRFCKCLCWFMIDDSMNTAFCFAFFVFCFVLASSCDFCVAHCFLCGQPVSHCNKVYF